MGLTSAEPDLYSVDEGGVPTLYGTRDSAGNVSFPFQTYGSEYNGDHGADLSRVELSGAGTIAATASVRSPASFTVASIVLDEGPLIRALLADGASVARRGDRVRATTTEVVNGGGSVAYELRFELGDAEPSGGART